MSDQPDSAAAPETNETKAAAGREEEAKKKNRLTKGVAVGIGSAAIVAALLYANRSRKGDK
ncbi:hypothetical protein ACFQRC_09290 [Enterovirga sp. GCM10030262]|uniref:hypothetical protein n=1 Tax=Enterovirga sp. GCM10030262 TaxID=3273391 RepID=UPI003607DDA7